MANQHLHLDIPEPCSEKWEDMTAQDQGRHCQKCARSLTDFSTMTDRQLIQYFQNYQGKLCGRFRKDQLNRPIHPQLPKAKRHMRWLAAVGLGLLSPLASAQTTPISSEAVKNKTTSPLDQKSILPPQSNIVEGIILSDEGEPIILAYVELKNTNVIVKTDFEGRFKMDISAWQGEGPAILKVSYTGYLDKEFSVEDLVHPIIMKHGLADAVMVVGYFVPTVEEEPEDDIPSSIEISGKVVDEQDGEPLIGANIFGPNLSTGTVTDIDGNFVLHVPNYPDFELMISYTGYETRTIRLSDISEGISLNVVLTPSEYPYIVGLIAYHPRTLIGGIGSVIRNWRYNAQLRKERRQERRAARKAQKTIARREKLQATVQPKVQKEETSISTTSLAKVYPNPASTELYVSYQSPIEQTLELEIINELGQSIGLRSWKLSAGDNQEQIDLNICPVPGIYYLRIIGQEGVLDQLAFVKN